MLQETRSFRQILTITNTFIEIRQYFQNYLTSIELSIELWMHTDFLFG